MPPHRYLLRARDHSSHGGHVLALANRPLIAGQAQALVGDPVFCPRCQGHFPIVGWQRQHPLPRGQAAAAGMVTGCGAILHATQQQQSLAVDFHTMALSLLAQFAQTAYVSAFEDPQYPHDSPQNPFAQTVLVTQLRARLSQTLALPNLSTPHIQQGLSSLCGPACFAHCLLQDRPDLYVTTILALWQHGHAQLGEISLKPSHRARHPKRFTIATSQGALTHLPMVDWVLLASLKDSSNHLLPYATPHSKTAGITYWHQLTRWFHAVGAPTISQYYAVAGSRSDQINQLSQHWHPGQHVIGLIGAGMLHNGRGRFSNHWVVLTEPPKPYAPSPDAQALIRPKLFSWGRVQSQGKSGLTFKRFKQHFYGAWVYGQIP